VDAEGFFYLTGRLNRFAKLFGRRFSLEDIEKDLEARHPLEIAVMERDGQLLVYAAPRGNADLSSIAPYLAARLGIPPKYIRVQATAAIPLTASGKKNYAALAP
jgi:acyl-coenzyme A synthetase/AMP-(fatty) acid ligase